MGKKKQHSEPTKDDNKEGNSEQQLKEQLKTLLANLQEHKTSNPVENFDEDELLAEISDDEEDVYQEEDESEVGSDDEEEIELDEGELLAYAGVQEKKVTINDKDGLTAKVTSFAQLPWVETLSSTAKMALQLDENGLVHDDFQRETAFYNQTLETVNKARGMLDQSGIKYLRPDDYFAEMLKSDAHMSKVRGKLNQEKKYIDAAQQRRKQRENKKFGKQVQIQKEMEKKQEKKKSVEEVKKWRQKRKNADDGDEEFPIAVDGTVNVDSRKRKGAPTESKGPNKKRKMKDEKFGFGGSMKNKKKNTRESTNDFSDFKQGNKGAKGGKQHVGKKGGKKVATKRPGKSKRLGKLGKKK